MNNVGGAVMEWSPDSGVSVFAGSQDGALGLAIDSNALYWTAGGDCSTCGSIQTAPLSGGPPKILANGLTPWGIAVDSAAVYCTDFNNAAGNGFDYAVLAIPIDGGIPETLAPGQQNLQGQIAIDSSWVYWTDSNAGTVMKVTKSGGSPITLAQGQIDPLGLAVDDSFVYWTEWSLSDAGELLGDAGAIMKAPLDGGLPIFLAPASLPMRIAKDSADLFWLDSSSNLVRLSMDGGAPIIFENDGSGTGAFTLDADYVYWEDEGVCLSYKFPSSCTPERVYRLSRSCNGY